MFPAVTKKSGQELRGGEVDQLWWGGFRAREVNSTRQKKKHKKSLARIKTKNRKGRERNDNSIRASW